MILYRYDTLTNSEYTQQIAPHSSYTDSTFDTQPFEIKFDVSIYRDCSETYTKVSAPVKTEFIVAKNQAIPATLLMPLEIFAMWVSKYDECQIDDFLVTDEVGQVVNNTAVYKD